MSQYMVTVPNKEKSGGHALLGDCPQIERYGSINL